MRITTDVRRVLREADISREDIRRATATNPKLHSIFKGMVDPSKIAFLTEEKYRQGRRQNMSLDCIRMRLGMFSRPGRLIKKVFPGINDEVVKKFSNIWNTSFNSPDGLRFTISKTEREFLNWYYGNSYASDSGSLGSSCMRGSEEQAYLRFYTRYCDVNLLVLLNYQEEVEGRAILWNNITIDGKNYPAFMDRVYTCNQSYEENFFRYAAEHNFPRKATQCYGENIPFILPNGMRVTDDDVSVAIRDDFSDNTSFPFLDTLAYLDSDFCKLRNFPQVTTKECLQSTTGGSYSIYTCDICGVVITDPDDVRWIDDVPYCSCCAVYSNHHHEYIIESEAISVGYYSSYMYQDELTYCAHLGGNRMTCDCIHDEDNDEWYHRLDCVLTCDTERWIPSTRVLTSNGYVYEHKENIPESEEEEEIPKPPTQDESVTVNGLSMKDYSEWVTVHIPFRTIFSIGEDNNES